jgi:hypothetical protein
MSILGHVAYGLVLGYVARSMLTSLVDDEAERVGVS